MICKGKPLQQLIKIIVMVIAFGIHRIGLLMAMYVVQ